MREKYIDEAWPTPFEYGAHRDGDVDCHFEGLRKGFVRDIKMSKEDQVFLSKMIAEMKSCIWDLMDSNPDAYDIMRKNIKPN